MKRATAFVWLALLAGLPVSAARAELKPIVLRPAAAPVLPLDGELRRTDEADEQNAKLPVLLPPPPTKAKVRRTATDLPSAGALQAEQVQLAAHQSPLKPQRVFRLLGLAAQARERALQAAAAEPVNPLRSSFVSSPALRAVSDQPPVGPAQEPVAAVEERVADEGQTSAAEETAEAEQQDKRGRFALIAVEPVGEAAPDEEPPQPIALTAGAESETAPTRETLERTPQLAAAETPRRQPPREAQPPVEKALPAPQPARPALAPFITTAGPSGRQFGPHNTLRSNQNTAQETADTAAPLPAQAPPLAKAPQVEPSQVEPSRAEQAQQLAAARLARGSARPSAENAEASATNASENIRESASRALAQGPSSNQRMHLRDTSGAQTNLAVQKPPVAEPPAAPPLPQSIAVWKDPEPQASPRTVVALQQPRQEAQPPEPGDVALTRFQDQNPAAPGSLGPFEVIEEESQAIEVQVRRSKLLRTQFDIYRTAVVDAAICEVAQFTPREAAIIGKSEGATNVTFWFQGQQRPVTYLVRVSPDVEKIKETEQEYELLEKMLAQHFPDSKVSLTVIADKVLVKGQARDSEEAAQVLAIVRNQANAGNVVAGNRGYTLGAGQAADVLGEDATGRQRRRNLQVINMLRVPGVQQVALRVKIAELNRSAARGFGVDISGPNDGPAIINFTDNPDGSALFLQSLLNVAAGNAPALLTQFDGDDIQIGIRYLQQHGVLRLLSEPTLVTLSGRPATFVAGGEFAVPTVVGSAGLNAVTTDFRAFGVIISFMPTVLDKDRIRLQVAPEFSQVNSDLTVNNTPGLNVRAVTTTVEMREGQTLAIAGLLEDTMQGTNTGDIPFLAKLLGRRNMSRNETELLILVTPELVQPMEAEETPPLPGFDVTEPTNGQFFLRGDLEGDPTSEYRSTVWPRLHKRYRAGGPSMISGPFGHGQ